MRGARIGCFVLNIARGNMTRVVVDRGMTMQCIYWGRSRVIVPQRPLTVGFSEGGEHNENCGIDSLSSRLGKMQINRKVTYDQIYQTRHHENYERVQEFKFHWGRQFRVHYRSSSCERCH